MATKLRAAHRAKKKSAAQLDREIHAALSTRLASDQQIEEFLETLDVTLRPDDQGMVNDSYRALAGDYKARERLTAIIEDLGHVHATKRLKQSRGARARSLASHARIKGPAADTTDALLPYLAEHGFVGSRGNPRAIRVAGDMVFVKERTDSGGNVEVTLSHPPKGGRAQTYHQRLGSRPRALTELQRIVQQHERFEKSPLVRRAHAKRAKFTADALFNVDATDPDIAPEVMVALDAFEANRPDAYKLLVGLPATIRIDSDWYAAKVIRATPKTVTAVRIDRGAFPPTVFHLTKRGWRAGPYSLSIGAARTLLGF